jgi:imidazolonepropionase-like amidohydrolase
MFIAFSAFVVFSVVLGQPHAAESRGQLLASFVDESRIDELLADVSARFRPQSFAIQHVNLVSVTEGRIIPDQAVIVEGDRITRVAASPSIVMRKGLTIIDGRERYLSPGLTDMHVHQLTSSSQHLLNLTQGVTTVRDMDGFPWTLAMRTRIRRGELLAPNQYITGQILNGTPMGFYTRVVTTPEEGRAAVREQQATGYDFIKVHNIMKPEVYAAVLDEAHKLGIDVVGHIPHDITVAEAIRLGQRTLEHFKGYILDQGLTISGEDWVSATKGADVWLCPTFYTYRATERGEEALKILRLPEMRYVSWRDRFAWRQLGETPVDQGIAQQQNILPMSQEIFRRLLPIGPRFIAGTDSGGGYPFMVPGFALHEELRIMHDTGLSPVDTLRTATLNAAAAMRQSSEFGSIEPGKRADLLLLTDNPLADPANLSKISAVVVRGIVLNRSDLDSIEAQIRAIYDPQPTPAVSPPPLPAEITAMVRRMESLRKKGYIFRDHDVDQLAEALRREGLSEQAARIVALRYRP